MFVNALNHHPQLDVRHVDRGHRGNGPIKGYAACRLSGGCEKAIILTRNSKDRLLSYRTDLAFNGKLAYHTREPVKVHRTKELAKGQIKSQKQREKLLLERANNYPKKLFISYEEMTGNKDIREIPEKYVNQICEFLEIEPHPMPTDYYKPEVINA